MTDQPAPDGARRPFAAFLHEQRGGALHGELTDALAQLVLAVREHGGKGTLQLHVVVASNRDSLTVTVADKIKLTVPEAERGAAIFFADDDGNLTRNNPAQAELPLREVRKAEEA